jgi:glycosyltransferase involved in cell wall biosynthesis
MNPEIKISVVMGVYNGEQYLAETIESIFNQEDVAFLLDKILCIEKIPLYGKKI